jgi:uncharacterized surface protein with fasciclin (FAS1) repeats
MNRLVNKILNASLSLALLAMILFVTSCDDFEQDKPVSGPSIADVAANNADLNIFYAALRKTGLAKNLDNLSYGGTYTVFAPHDSAFAVYIKNSVSPAQPAWDEVDVLNFINNTLSTSSTPSISTLVTRLNYHIFSSTLEAGDITGNQVFTTLQGSRLSLSKNGSTVVLNANVAGTGAGNGAKVRTVDFAAANGVIHTVNKVLNPPTTASAMASLGVSVSYATNPATVTPSLANAELAADGNNNDFDILVYAIVKGEMATTFLPNTTPLPDFTIFTPNDGRFIAFLGVADEAAAIAALKAMAVADVANVVKKHAVAARVLSTDLTNGQVVNTLLAGKTLTVSISGGVVTLTDGNNNPDVTTANVLTNAGVLHRIDDVIN